MIVFATGSALAAPPATPVTKVTDTYAGIAIDDPYRHLEQLDSADVKDWARAQGSDARATLDVLPGRAALAARIKELSAKASDRVYMVTRLGRSTYFMKKQPTDALGKLYVRTGKAADRALFDPDTMKAATGKTYAINNYAISPNGRYAAMVLSVADAELGAIHVLDIKSGTMVGATVPRIWGELSAIWLPDSEHFVYTRSSDPARAYGKNQMIVHRVGSDGKDDQPLLGYDIDSTVKTRENDWPFLTVSASSPYAVLQLVDGVGGMPRVYVQPRDQLGKPGAVWRELIGESAKVRRTTHAGKWLYGRTFDSASRYRVLRWDLSHPEAVPVEVVPQQSGVIEDIGAGSDGLFYVVRTGAVSDLFALRHGDGAGKARKVGLPLQGSIYLSDSDQAMPGVVFSLEPWTAPLDLMMTRVGQANAMSAGLIVNKGQPYDDVIAIETTCPARDGAKVPISILMKRGLKLDGSNPTFMEGYAGYGMTITAEFSPTWAAWLERGGILALANPRGSGAYGEEWYQAGRGATKPNTWRDMIDCAEFLVKERYTAPAKLAVRGVSMGGVAAGRALTERPDLFGTAILQVGLLDAVRTIVASQNGPNHLLEMGDVKTEAGVRQLLAMSSYHNVTRAAYPAVMVITGMNDNRVEPWMSFKMAARLQQETTSGKPVLLRVDEQAGHGMTSTTEQRNAMLADTLAFHLWQTGDPQFQPK
ncbi:prolyl oligopeptidase family serine peptidase [Massilia sp. CF038]|uniref:prolyl oligopeptidase family serine peptidase n=1 Tax=Massilia sp. CF038 TaxID=1881045 RepID=UPI000933E103|nr:prolyl oligopeptidase family serine peptidase [Massilia sp. CF038]